MMMLVYADLGSAADFATFDAENGYFKVHSMLVNQTHVGVHEITLRVASLDNTLTDKLFTNSFNLTVLAHDIDQPGAQTNATSWFPGSDSRDSAAEAEVLYVKDWNGPVYESYREQPYSSEQPVPYVADLTLNGLLEIGWDTLMKPWDQVNLAQLNQTKVAVKEWEEKTIYYRRKLRSEERFVVLIDELTYESDLYQIQDALSIDLMTSEEDSDF